MSPTAFFARPPVKRFYAIAISIPPLASGRMTYFLMLRCKKH